MRWATERMQNAGLLKSGKSENSMNIIWITKTGLKSITAIKLGSKLRQISWYSESHFTKYIAIARFDSAMKRVLGFGNHMRNNE